MKRASMLHHLNGMVISAAFELLVLFAVVAGNGFAQQAKPLPTPAESLTRNFDDVNRKVLEMAKDLSGDKYSYRPAPGLRSFAEVFVHIASGNVFAAKAGRGEKAEWTELDAKSYPGKDQIVAELQKSINDADATLKATPATQYTRTLAPWVGVIEHAGEHYGQLVVYYRNNNLVPPETRNAKNQ